MMSVPFTDTFVLHMRMRHTIVGGGRMWIVGDHLVVVGMAVGQIAPIEANCKRPEIGPFQLDRFGRHRDGLTATVKGNLVKLVMQCHKIGI